MHNIYIYVYMCNLYVCTYSHLLTKAIVTIFKERWGQLQVTSASERLAMDTSQERAPEGTQGTQVPYEHEAFEAATNNDDQTVFCL